MPPRPASVFMEEAPVLQQQEHPQQQRVLRLHAPRCAATATAGQFIYLQCDTALRMRRPYSIMSVSAQQGWVEILYKIVGHGSLLLSKKGPGDTLNSIGPVGKGFTLHSRYPRPLLLGGGVGVPPILFLAKLLEGKKGFSPLVILASERPFPFLVCESKIAVTGLDKNLRATHAGLEAAGIPAMLCRKQACPGCFDGFAHEIADKWLSRLNDTDRAQVEVFSCGPNPMLKAVASLASKYALPCQLSLEENMACGLGGCAGCVVAVKQHNQISMKRVCVDGPVFDASTLRL